MELLERIAEAQGKLLRVERLAPVGSGDEWLAAALLLTFEVGRVLFTVDQAGGGVSEMQLEARDDAPDDMLDMDEEEPWWRVRGNPLVGVWRDPAVAILRLQFRADADNPRFISLQGEGEVLRVRLEQRAH